MWGRLACTAIALAGCGGSTAGSSESPDAGSSEAPEVCNGLDDNRDGRIDEGCPCAPYSIELPLRIAPMLVSLGQGCATVAFDSPTYVHLDDAGQVVAMAELEGFSVYDRQQGLAWDGTRLGYFPVTTDDLYLAFLAPDGQSVGRGPSLGVPGTNHHAIAATPDGYHALSAEGLPLRMTFFALDRDGAATTMMVDDSATPVYPLVIVEQHDAAIVLSSYQSDSRRTVEYRIGAPGHSVSVTYDGAGGSVNVISGRAASDGETVLVTAGGRLFAFDGSTVRQVWGLAANVYALAVSWTGRAWVVLADHVVSGSSVDLITFDASLAVTATEPLFTPNTGGSPYRLRYAALASDARRVLVTFQDSAGGSRLIQVCR